MLTATQAITSPIDFAATFLKIQDKQKNLVPFRWNKAQAHFQAHRTGKDIVLKARQLGISSVIRGEMYRRTVTSTRTTITLSHDADATANFRIMDDRFHEHCKFGNIQPQRKYANASLTTYPEFDSAAIIATAGNVETGRGNTYTDMHGSEVAFWKDAEKIIAGAMQGGNPDVILESTPNGAQGYFYEQCMEALRGDSIWTLHFYPWWWDAGYRIPIDYREVFKLNSEEEELLKKHNLDPEQIAWRRYKQKELREKFKQEYPEDPITCFLTSGNSYFGDLSNSYNAPLNAVWQEGHEYVAGLDFGQTNDYTAMLVIDKATKQMVDLLHIRKLEWSEQRRRIIEKYKYWHCVHMGAESNSIGSVNIEELLRAELNMQSFETTNASKSDAAGKLYEGLHTDGLQLQDIQVLRHEMTTFVSSQTSTGVWRLAAEGDGHDDTVMGLIIAWWSVNNVKWLMR